MNDAKGSLTPLELVREQDLLQDETVRRLFAAAQALATAIAAFKTTAFDDVDSFVSLLSEQYGVKRGGTKGNITLSTYDGCGRIQVQISDRVEFGPELQAAKTLVDECLEEWSADSRAEIRKLVMDAFDVDKEGKINRSKLFALLRYQIEDERWVRGMQALRDSIRTIGSNRFIRFYWRKDPRAAFVGLVLDVSGA